MLNQPGTARTRELEPDEDRRLFLFLLRQHNHPNQMIDPREFAVRKGLQTRADRRTPKSSADGV